MRRFLVLLFGLLLAASPAWAQCVDVNNADATGLDTLPGIGPAKAATIIAYRDQNGPFLAVEDLIHVSGIGPATLEKMRPMVCAIGPDATVTTPASGGDTSQAPAGASTTTTAAPASDCIDANTASADQLKALPGVGDTKATDIVAYRDAHGGFSSVDDLRQVKGIGAATLEKMRPLLCPVVGGTQSVSASPSQSATSATSGPASAPQAAAIGSDGCIDINSADASALTAIPGIGASKAQAIVDHRTAVGAFSSLSALTDVKGIGASTRDKMTAYLCPLGGDPSTPPDEAAPASSSASTTGSAPATARVNINTASVQELQALPGIGQTKASAIYDDRQANGPFASCSDLGRVSGVGPATVAQVGDACTVE